MNYFILLMFLGCPGIRAFDKLNILHEWKYVDFLWNNVRQKAEAIESGNYNMTSCIPYDTDRAPDGRIFVTVVRSAGVPATLTTVSEKMGAGGPLLKPYPDWSWNGPGRSCKKIIGVYRVAVSSLCARKHRYECKCGSNVESERWLQAVCQEEQFSSSAGRSYRVRGLAKLKSRKNVILKNNLYVLDTGNNGERQICPAKLLIFDLTTDELVNAVSIPSKYSTNKNGTGLLVTPIVGGKGPDFRVYMADTEGYGLVIWDGITFARIESKPFKAESDATHFVIGNDSFDLADGILGMALAPNRGHGLSSRLYFRPLASYSMYNVDVKDFRRQPYNAPFIRILQEPNRMRSQSAAQAFSSDGVLFFSSLTDRSLICWNRRKIFNNENTVQFAINNETLQFPSGIKVVGSRRRGKDTLLVMTNRYQQVANNDMDFTDVNFRIHVGTVNDIVRNTNCE